MVSPDLTASPVTKSRARRSPAESHSTASTISMALFEFCRRRPRVDQPEMAERVENGAVGDVDGAGIVVLAAFQRHAIAADRPHIFRGADALGGIALPAAAAALQRRARIGRHPAMHDGFRAKSQRERAFRLGQSKRLDLAAVILRSDKDERLAPRAERMDVQQHLVRAQELAQGIADQILVIRRVRALTQIAIEIAVALARVGTISLHVHDRNEGDLSAPDREFAGPAIGDGAADRQGSANLVAMDRAGHEQFRAGMQTAETHGFDRRRAVRLHAPAPARPRNRCRSPCRAASRRASSSRSSGRTATQPAVPLMSGRAA